MTSETALLDAALDARTGRLALAQMARPLEIWDLAAEERWLELAEYPATSVGFHSTEPILYAGTEAGAGAGAIVALRLGEEREPLWTVAEAHRGRVLALAVKPDGSQLLSGGADGVVRLWDAASGSLLHERRSHSGSVWDLGFMTNHPRGSYLASVGADGDLGWLDAKSLMPYPPTRLHQGRINDMDVAPDGTYATAGNDGVIALFDANRPALVGGLRLDLGAPISSIAVHPSGEALALAYGGGGQVAILEGDPRALRTSPFAAGSPIAASAYHPSGRYLVLGTADGRVLLWTPGAPEAVAFLEHKGEIVDLAIAPDGRRLVTLGEDRLVLEWEIRDGSLGPPRVLDTEGWRTLAFDGEGSLLAVGRADGSIRVIRTASGEDAALLQDDPPIFSTRLAFHPKVPLLASGNGYGQVRFWDSRTFADRPPQLSGHRGEINGIAFDMQGDRLLTSGRDMEVRLWTLGDGTLIAPLGGHQGVIRTLGFSQARSEVVSGGLDGLVILRSLAAERWVEDGCGLYGREFAPEEIKAYGLEQDRSRLCRSPVLWENGLGEGAKGFQSQLIRAEGPLAPRR